MFLQFFKKSLELTTTFPFVIKKVIEMKQTMLSFFASGLVLAALGQNPVPPKEVQVSFAEKFNAVQKLKWEQEDNEWEARFKFNATEMSSSFDNSGKWLETETEVKKKDVPEEVFKAVNLKFDGWEIEEVEKVEKPDFKGYEIVLEKGETETEVLVTTAGGVTIEKVKVEDDDKD